MFRKIAATMAATAMLLATTAAQANSAAALSLRNAPVTAKTGQVRAGTPVRHGNEIVASPLFIILGIVAVVGVLEITGAINIFGDDEPDSP